MNQTHSMVPMKNGVKKRWQYLWEVTSARAMLAFGVAITMLCGFVTYLIVVRNRPLHDLGNVYWILVSLGGVGVLVCLGIAGACGIWMWLSSLTRLHSLTYVAPIREQVAALPADEILLRGSDPPVASPDELLRSVYSRSPDASDMLLRHEPSPTGAESQQSVKGVKV